MADSRCVADDGPAGHVSPLRQRKHSRAYGLEARPIGVSFDPGLSHGALARPVPGKAGIVMWRARPYTARSMRPCEPRHRRPFHEACTLAARGRRHGRRRISTVALLPAAAGAAEPVKIGLIAPFSGSFADYGKQMEGGIKAYQKVHGDSVAGRKVTVILKDTTGPVPGWPSGWRRSWWCATRSTSGRLRAHARSAGGGPGGGRAEADGHHERGIVGDHHQIQLHHARLDDPAPGVGADGRLGGQEQAAQGGHPGGRLRARHRCRDRVQDQLHRRRRRVVESIRVPLRNPEFAPSSSASGRAPRGRIPVPAGRRAGRRLHEGLPRTRRPMRASA